MLLAIAAGVAQAADLSLLQKHEDNFVKYVKKYDVKLEGASEYKERLAVYARNSELISTHNAGNYTWTLGENQFTHLTFEEFSSMYLSSKMPERETRMVDTFANVKAADSVDWSTTDAVTDVKDQGQCGSCWAFSTTGAMEAAYFKKNGKQLAFSEQQLVSCDVNFDQGCNGGIMDNAFAYITMNGLCTENDYPYTSGNGDNGVCQESCSKVDGTKGLTLTDVQPNSEDVLAKAVTQQPIAVAVDADENWQHYAGGILTDVAGTQLDHGVLAVGFGTDDGQDFWKIKNSWAETWGEDGYIRILRNIDQDLGPCGITQWPSYPTLA